MTTALLSLAWPEKPSMRGPARNARCGKDRLSFLSDHPLNSLDRSRRPAMGIFVTFSKEELEEFEAWRRKNAKSGEVIVIEAVSKRRPDSFKVWFEKPVGDQNKLPWFKPIEEKRAEADDA
jgi:hypothetical protein